MMFQNTCSPGIFCIRISAKKINGGFYDFYIYSIDNYYILYSYNAFHFYEKWSILWKMDVS